MITDNDAHALMLGASNVLKQYAGSDASRASVEVMDRLIACYWIELGRVDETNLRALQAALRQVQALREVFLGDSQTMPLIGFS